MRKKPHDRILKGQLKEQQLSIVSKFCVLYFNPYVCVFVYFFVEKVTICC